MKKVLSLVLTLSLVLGSFSMAFAATGNKALPDIAGDKNEEAIKVVYDLGIIEGMPNGDFESDREVTRAEFATMIVRALAIPDSALAGYTASYNDMGGYSWASGAIGFCTAKGIMIGDGYGNVMPGRTISPNEAVTMCLRTIGYIDNSAELVGAWPSNYVSKGKAEGLYDDVSDDAQIKRGAAAQMIYNLLTVQMVQVATDGTTTKLWDEQPTNTNDGVKRTLLSAGLNCKAESGILTDAFQDRSISLIPYLGMNGDLYISDNGKGKAVAFDAVDCVMLNGYLDGSDISTDDGDYKLGDFKDAVTSVVDTNTTAGSIELFKDGEHLGKSSVAKNVTDIGLDKKSRFSIAVEVSGKTIKDVYSILHWDNADTFLFESGMITADDFNGYDFPMNDDDEIDYTAFALLGVAELDDIKVDNVIYISMNDDDEITRIAVGATTVEGKISRINGADYRIDGKDYDVSENSTVEFALGDEGKFFLDFYNDLYDFDGSGSVTGNYAVFLASNNGSAGFVQFKLFTKDGNEKAYDVKSSVIPTATASLSAIVDTIVRVDINSSNVVADMWSHGAGNNASSKDRTLKNEKNVFGRFSDDGTVFTKKPSNVGIAIDSNATVFIEDTSGDYSMGTLATVDKDNDITIAALTFDGKGKVQALIVKDNYTGTDDMYVFINKVGSEKNSNGDTVDLITGLDAKTGKEITMQSNVSGGYSGFTGALQKFRVDGDTLKNGANATIAKSSVSIGAISSTNLTITGGSISVEALTDAKVFYNEGSKWKVNTNPQTYVSNVIKDNPNEGWTLYKTDDKKGYDIIVRDKAL